MPVLGVIRWGWRTVRGPLSAYLLVRGTAVLWVTVQADAVVDWITLRAAYTQSPSLWVGIALGGLFLLNGLGERAAVRRLWLVPHGFLRRQPLTRVERGIASMVLLAVMASPWGFVGLLVSGSAVTAALWMSGAAVVSGAWAGRRPDAGVVASVLVGGLAGLGHAHLVLALLGIVLSLGIGVWGLGSAARDWALESEGRRVRSFVPRPRTVLGSLVQRDSRVLLRTSPGHGLGAAGLGVVVGLVTGLIRHNNPDPAGLLTGAGLIGLGMASLVAHGGLRAVVRQLGERLDPPRWPVTASTRAVGLGVVAAGLMAPSWAAAASGGLGVLSAFDHLHQVVVWLALAAGLAWWGVQAPSQTNLGTYLWWMLALVGLGVAWPVVGAVTAMLAGTGALAATLRRLERDRWRR